MKVSKDHATCCNCNRVFVLDWLFNYPEKYPGAKICVGCFYQRVKGSNGESKLEKTFNKIVEKVINND